MDGRKRQREAQHHRQQKDEDQGQLNRQVVAHAFGKVVEKSPAFKDPHSDRVEIVVGQHRRGRLFGDIRALDPHGNADIGRLQRQDVIDAIAGYGHHFVVALERLHDAVLVLRRGTGKYGGGSDRLSQRLIRKLIDLGSIAGDHDRADAGPRGAGNRLLNAGARRIF